MIVLPLGVLFASSLTAPAGEWSASRVATLTGKSFALAAGIALAAMVLGFVPGRLLGTARRGRHLLLALLLAPLLLPRYVTYYAWTMLLGPTTRIGAALAASAPLARFVYGAAAFLSLTLWYWPLAAILIAQGWRGLDDEMLRGARLDAGGAARLAHVTLPLLGRSLVLAFAVCFVLALSELGTFDLAGIETLGTKIGLEMARLYEMTGSAGAAARAGAPLTVAALLAAALLWRSCFGRGPQADRPPLRRPDERLPRWQWAVVIALLGWSVLAPLALLVGGVRSAGPYRGFWRLHGDELGGSALTACGAAVLAVPIAAAVSSLGERAGRAGRALSAAAHSTVFLAMFLPGSLIAVAMLRLASLAALPDVVRQGWWIVSAGQAARFAGVALIVLGLARDSRDRRLADMAAADGATWRQAWWYVHLPRVGLTVLAAFLLVAAFAMTELSATMVLLPAGVPNFAQTLLNQMHYARDQQVIASCLAIWAGYAALAALAAGGAMVLRFLRARHAAVAVLVLLALAGCGSRSDGEAKVVGVFGQTGRGDGEFIYPRAIDLAGDAAGDGVWVVDKTGRIQRLGPDGRCVATIRMPQTQVGLPTGISRGTDGNLYVADTHYHRVAVYTPAGRLAATFGRYGTGDGQFIYPTDVAFAPDGRIYVSEYGGNDRVSIYSSKYDFLGSFGSQGEGQRQFSRPSALCVDGRRGVLYVADACNHRIARYNLDGELLGYFGAVGPGRGELRYPYDLAMMPDGRVLVCEYGNSRLQMFGPEGRSLGTFGSAGRELGRLAYPWGVTVDKGDRAFVVDSGSNRIQIWQL